MTWDPVSNKLELFYNDAVSGSCYSVFSYLGDIINNIFNGNSFVYWGFTGSTGSATNNQEVCVNSYENWNLGVENQYICVYDSVLVSNNSDLTTSFGLSSLIFSPAFWVIRDALVTTA